MTDTVNISITKAAYTEIAAVGALGIYSNPYPDDFMYIAYAAAQPAATFLGHSLAPHKGHDFSLSPNPIAKIWARFADESLRADGYIVVSLGW
jgi:hypothetical protein